jgi:hypothetical protein
MLTAIDECDGLARSYSCKLDLEMAAGCMNQLAQQEA